jgi:hypothetical protein
VSHPQPQPHFFEMYRDDEKVVALPRQLSWTHNLSIIGQCKRPEEREFYLRMANREKGDKRGLDRQRETEKKAFTFAAGSKRIASNTPAKPMQTKVSTLKSCGFFSDANNTLGMPLTDAHFAGSFPAQSSGPCCKQLLHSNAIASRSCGFLPAQTNRLDEQVAALPRLRKTTLFERSVMQPEKVSPAVRHSHPGALDVFRDAYMMEFLDLPPGHAIPLVERNSVLQRR